MLLLFSGKFFSICFKTELHSRCICIALGVGTKKILEPFSIGFLQILHVPLKKHLSICFNRGLCSIELASSIITFMISSSFKIELLSFLIGGIGYFLRDGGSFSNTGFVSVDSLFAG